MPFIENRDYSSEYPSNSLDDERYDEVWNRAIPNLCKTPSPEPLIATNFLFSYSPLRNIDEGMNSHDWNQRDNSQDAKRRADIVSTIEDASKQMDSKTNQSTFFKEAAKIMDNKTNNSGMALTTLKEQATTQVLKSPISSPDKARKMVKSYLIQSTLDTSFRGRQPSRKSQNESILDTPRSDFTEVSSLLESTPRSFTPDSLRSVDLSIAESVTTSDEYGSIHSLTSSDSMITVISLRSLEEKTEKCRIVQDEDRVQIRDFVPTLEPIQDMSPTTISQNRTPVSRAATKTPLRDTTKTPKSAFVKEKRPTLVRCIQRFGRYVAKKLNKLSCLSSVSEL